MNDIEHDHEFEELVIVDKGSGTHILNGEPISIQMGDVFYVNRYDYHYYENLGSLCLTNILFRDDVKFNYIPSQKEILKDIFGSGEYLTYSLNIRHRAPFFNLIAQINALLPESGASVTARREGLLLQLFSLLNSSKQPVVAHRISTNIERLLEQLRAEHCSPVDWRELCRRHGLSERTLYRAVRRITGYSPENYLMRLRLRTAKHLLLFSETSISDIALQSGFKNLSHFSQSYKRFYNLTPREERLKASNE
ncbi:helix-turn-helix domain-containing protein [Samsonia erythrinae]|uniref:helix-turn-helix domain-containing protein n=1 Tax=Samsonia erythrinae TaxID=160434 RepID=UPI00140427EF|nr:helix-turn-helix domain-containing protein [Samsonia erythrinae]